MKTYKDLKVWQTNQKCIKRCASLIESLPNTIPARTISEQLFRALVSIGANLAEGYGSYEGKEYPRYIKIALRSAVESDHWFHTLLELPHGRASDICEIQELNVETIKMLKGLIKGVENKRAHVP